MYRIFRCAGAGEFGCVDEVDADLENVWFGIEDCGQAGDEVVGSKEPPALAQMQPEPTADLLAHLGELGVRPAVGEFEEPVALLSRSSITSPDCWVWPGSEISAVCAR